MTTREWSGESLDAIKHSGLIIDGVDGLKGRLNLKRPETESVVASIELKNASGKTVEIQGRLLLSVAVSDACSLICSLRKL
ncbi:hypothetical protein [Henriciella litoralis]|uniref:hypothetical protein n=1 Tax=Henriciella litoralis TaxID=568102 RepID=UPI00146C595B|nr:hypothetical protein [Henriciella litoralis]